ncbi:MAG: DUF3563 family protein [Betaproteobacteria bacterium]
MRNSEFPSSLPTSRPRTLIARLRKWSKPQEWDAKYLAAASDLADLERRMRTLNQPNYVTFFVTFNH